MIQWTSRGRPNYCGNLRSADDNTRMSYTCPSPSTVPLPLCCTSSECPFTFLSFFFFFFFTCGPIWCVSIMAFHLSRRMPRGLSWLVTSFQMPAFVAYKYQNSPPALRISKKFLLDICRLEPCLKILLHLQSSSVQSQVFSLFSSLGFPLSFPQQV